MERAEQDPQASGVHTKADRDIDQALEFAGAELVLGEATAVNPPQHDQREHVNLEEQKRPQPVRRQRERTRQITGHQQPERSEVVQAQEKSEGVLSLAFVWQEFTR
jgi:hypothetical protein